MSDKKSSVRTRRQFKVRLRTLETDADSLRGRLRLVETEMEELRERVRLAEEAEANSAKSAGDDDEN